MYQLARCVSILPGSSQRFCGIELAETRVFVGKFRQERSEKKQGFPFLRRIGISGLSGARLDEIRLLLCDRSV